MKILACSLKNEAVRWEYYNFYRSGGQNCRLPGAGWGKKCDREFRVCCWFWSRMVASRGIAGKAVYITTLFCFCRVNFEYNYKHSISSTIFYLLRFIKNVLGTARKKRLSNSHVLIEQRHFNMSFCCFIGSPAKRTSWNILMFQDHIIIIWWTFSVCIPKSWCPL